MKIKLVVATQKGFFGSRLIEEGTQFEVPVGETANWWKDAPNVSKPVTGHDGTSNDASLHINGGNQQSQTGAGAESPFAHFTKDQIMAELTSHGIEFNDRDKKDVLLALLIDAPAAG